jgi:hypothetical protein
MEVAKMFQPRQWRVDGNHRLMASVGGLGAIAPNALFLHRYLSARDELRQFRAEIRRRLELEVCYGECDDLVADDDIGRELRTYESPYPEFCVAVPDSSPCDLFISSDLVGQPSWDALELLSSVIRWLDDVIHLLLRQFSHPNFAHRTTLQQKAWSILHGSHPPKGFTRLAVRPCGTREGFPHAACLPS